MNTKSETTLQSFNDSERITTLIYIEEDNKFKIYKQVIVTNYFKSNYCQTVIKDKWGYTTMWYDNIGQCQQIGHDIILEGHKAGQLSGPSWFIFNNYPLVK